MRTVSFCKDGPYVGHGVAVVVMPGCSKGREMDKNVNESAVGTAYDGVH